MVRSSSSAALMLLMVCTLGVEAFCGCSNTEQPAVKETPLPDSVFRDTLALANLGLPSDPNQRFTIWLQFAGDTSWSFPVRSLANYVGANDSLYLYGTVIPPHRPDSIVRIAVSIDQTGDRHPRQILLTGDFSRQDSTARLASSMTLGDLSDVTGAVTFTTKSSDTNRAKSEYYLMEYSNGAAVPSIQHLPAPAPGWTYAAWMIDTNFFPQHRFFYGTFSSAAGPDSKPATDAYPFPGGFSGARLDDPGGYILVTLEDSSRMVGPNPPGPSRFTVLSLRLQRFIDFNETLPMENVTGQTIPGGRFRIAHH